MLQKLFDHHLGLVHLPDSPIQRREQQICLIVFVSLLFPILQKLNRALRLPLRGHEDCRLPSLLGQLELRRDPIYLFARTLQLAIDLEEGRILQRVRNRYRIQGCGYFELIDGGLVALHGHQRAPEQSVRIGKPWIGTQDIVQKDRALLDIGVIDGVFDQHLRLGHAPGDGIVSGEGSKPLDRARHELAIGARRARLGSRMLNANVRRVCIAQRDPTSLGFRFFHQIHVLDARQPPFQIIRLAALLGELIELS